MERFTRDNISFFRFASFAANGTIEHGGFDHAVFTRQGGISPAPYDTLNLSVSVPDDQANVYANRARAYATLGRRNDSLVHAYLAHGADVAQVTPHDYGRYVGPADGLITGEPGCGLTMNYADCAAILLYDPRNRVVGLGHAGWQGVVKDLPGSLVRAMRHIYGSDPAGLLAGIGPAIGPCCYQVGEKVIEPVQATFDDPVSLFRPSAEADWLYFDLPEASRRRLLDAGVTQIEDSGLCTACNVDLFFSHRAEKGRTGRFGVMIVLGE